MMNNRIPTALDDLIQDDPSVLSLLLGKRIAQEEMTVSQLLARTYRDATWAARRAQDAQIRREDDRRRGL